MVSVRYAETDRMGVAHHSSYLLWFELARTGLLRATGHTYRDLEANSSVRLPVLEYGCKFVKSADYDDALRIETTIRELKSRTVTFLYRVYRGDELIADAFTHHVCVDAEFKVRRFPDDVLRAMQGYVA